MYIYYMHHIFFIHSLISGHLGCFPTFLFLRIKSQLLPKQACGGVWGRQGGII